MSVIFLKDEIMSQENNLILTKIQAFMAWYMLCCYISKII